VLTSSMGRRLFPFELVLVDAEHDGVVRRREVEESDLHANCRQFAKLASSMTDVDPSSRNHAESHFCCFWIRILIPHSR
jgi:hypothetical protein